jgi:hypothetical protein
MDMDLDLDFEETAREYIYNVERGLMGTNPKQAGYWLRVLKRHVSQVVEYEEKAYFRQRVNDLQRRLNKLNYYVYGKY